jgi:hypothetical protein
LGLNRIINIIVKHNLIVSLLPSQFPLPNLKKILLIQTIIMIQTAPFASSCDNTNKKFHNLAFN